MKIDALVAHPAARPAARPLTALPLMLDRSARLARACGTRLTAVRACVWITIEGQARDVVLEPGESFVVDSDRGVFVSPLHAGDRMAVAVDTEPAAAPGVHAPAIGLLHRLRAAFRHPAHGAAAGVA